MSGIGAIVRPSCGTGSPHHRAAIVRHGHRAVGGDYRMATALRVCASVQVAHGAPGRPVASGGIDMASDATPAGGIA